LALAALPSLGVLFLPQLAAGPGQQRRDEVPLALRSMQQASLEQPALVQP